MPVASIYSESSMNSSNVEVRESRASDFEDKFSEDSDASDKSNLDERYLGPPFFEIGDEDLYNDTEWEFEFDSDSDCDNESALLTEGSALEKIRRLQKLDENGHQPLTRLQRAVVGNSFLGTWRNVPSYRKNTVSRRDAGKLAHLMNAPLDIFAEIASHLEPLDLLHLARASRQLRALFMSRQSRTVWKAARNAIRMPECPADLDEPAYASLVFELHCQVCDDRVNKPINFVLRLRFCDGCSYANIFLGASIVKKIDPKLVEDKNIYKLIPTQRDGDISWGRRDSYFFKPDFLDVIAKYLLVIDDPLKCKEFVEAQQKRRDGIIKEGRAIENWAKNYFDKKFHAREHARRNIKMKRLASMVKRLQEAGWSTEDINTVQGSWQFSKYANRHRKLEQRTWNRIYPELERILPEIRQQKEQEKKRIEERRLAQSECNETRREKRKEKKAKNQGISVESREQIAESRKQDNIEMKIKMTKWKKDYNEKRAIWGQEMGAEELNSKLEILSGLITEFSDRYQRHLTASQQYTLLGLSFIPNISDVLILLPEPLHSSVYGQSMSGPQLWDAIVPRLPSIFTTYKKKLQDKCMSLLLSTRGSLKFAQKEELKSTGKNPTTVFFFAWSFFKCTSEHCALLPLGRYPTIFDEEHNDDAWPEFGSRPRPKCFHLVQFLKCPDAIMQAACMLLTSLKLPLDTRMDDLCKLGQVFVCLRCNTSSGTKMTWESLVKHFSDKAEEVMNLKQDFYNTSNDHFANLSNPLALRMS